MPHERIHEIFGELVPMFLISLSRQPLSDNPQGHQASLSYPLRDTQCLSNPNQGYPASQPPLGDTQFISETPRHPSRDTNVSQTPHKRHLASLKHPMRHSFSQTPP